jgi:hypothetical protein
LHAVGASKQLCRAFHANLFAPAKRISVAIPAAKHYDHTKQNISIASKDYKVQSE